MNADRTEARSPAGGFWSGKRLSDEKQNIFPSSHPEQITVDCVAYHLRLGDEVYVTGDYDVKDGSYHDPRRGVPLRLKNNDMVRIPSGQFAFLLTEEIITMPITAMGFISVRSGVKFRGLVNVSGFHVDPGYYGRLMFAVYNAGPASVRLKRGEEIFLLFLADVVEPAQEYAKDAKEPRYTNIPSEVLDSAGGEVVSPMSLKAELTKLEGTFSALKWIGGVLITLAVALFGSTQYLLIR